MLRGLTLLLICQLIGEATVRGLGLPVPGPVLGMALLFCGFLLRGGIPKDVELVGSTLLQHLSLLFVPAGVGVMLYLPLFAAEWQAIAASLVFSTLLTIAVTALIMKWLLPRETPAKIPTAPPEGTE
jgi:holin-like protein